MGFNGIRKDVLTRVSRWLLVCRNGSLFLLPSTTCVLALWLLCDFLSQLVLSFVIERTNCLPFLLTGFVYLLVLVTHCW